MRLAFLSFLFFTTGCTLEFDPALLDEANGCACTDGVSCFPGTSPQACGKNGESCKQCNAPLSVCQAGACAVENAVVAMSLGSSHTGAVDRLGGLWMWGRNDQGSVGQPASVTEQQTPARVVVDGVEWSSIAVGGTTPALFSCGISKAGALYGWGTSSDGQTGLGSLQPGAVPTQVGTESDWVAVGTGSAYACGIRAGRLYCWGYASDSFRLGLASAPSDPRTPQEVPGSQSWKQLSVGDGHACAIREDQSLWCWGDADEGQLGHAQGQVPLQVEGGTSFIQVSAGGQHTCGIRSNRTLWCWGGNTNGELGFPQSASAPVQVESASDWLSVASGGEHTCGVRENGKLYCWGSGALGQLGSGTFDNAAVPTEVPDPGPWTSVYAGSEYSCGVRADGTIYCWGHNGNSQLGIEAPDFQPVPSPTNVLLED